MFTPPASPTPPRLQRHDNARDPSADTSDLESDPKVVLVTNVRSGTSPLSPVQSRARTRSKSTPNQPDEAKQRTARRMRWSILMVPAVLILITLSTRYLSHPAVLDLLSNHHGPLHWDVDAVKLHKRHPQAQAQTISLPTPTASQLSVAPQSSGSSSSATPTSASQTIPTIPASPPVLPTPFPQPLDTTLSLNFSTLGCENFVLNMTQSQPFRACRPFSLLEQSSSAFLEAQENITALNSIIWGTCNTDLSADQCNSNMGWFSSQMATVCATDLSNSNPQVVTTFRGLQAYSLLRNAACATDPTTDSYCYINAAHNSNPSDLYYYQLPFGTPLPNSTITKLTCSTCTKSILALYEQAQGLSALDSTLPSAVKLTQSQCGEDFVQGATTNSATGLRTTFGIWVLVLLGAFMSW
ncbi:hypothetical protein C8Q75DRAFT_753184 [Abortiporus biennis]|nr:hypothetical protein C8Q75DRAFT_753184 [Abortiporus biennis]